MVEKIEKKNWVSSFELVGTTKIKDDGSSFNIEATSQKSSWVYNSMNIGVDCGEKCGVIYTNLMGGYSNVGDKVIYTSSKDNEFMTVDWEDRLDESIINQVSPSRLITVGLERTSEGGIFKRRFISGYDAVAYIKEVLKPNDVVRVYGNLEWYKKNDGDSDARKTIKSIYISNAKPEEYKAKFSQSILIDKDSVSLKNIDKDRGVLFVDGIVLHYLKEVDGAEYKNQYPFNKTFEFPMDFSNKNLCTKIIDKTFKVKKDYTQVNFNGLLVGGSAVVLPTFDELPNDIKDLVELGYYTEEDLVKICASKSSSSTIRWVLDKPMIKAANDESNSIAELQSYPEVYTEEDLFSALEELKKPRENELDDTVSEVVSEMSSSDTDSMDWLNNL